MKVSRYFSVITLVASGLLVVLSACNDRASVNEPHRLNFDQAQFAIIDYADVENGVEDATPENNMAFNSTLLNYSVLGGDGPFGPGTPGLRGMRWFDRFNFGKHLGFLFRQLNLTDDQKTAIRDLSKNFHDTMRPLVRQFYEANKSLIEEANAQRKAVIDEVKAGTLTREEAAAKIKDLNQATRDKIHSNPASVTLKAAMCAERDSYYAGVKGVLVGDQITKWDNWIAKIPDPCLP